MRILLIPPNDLLRNPIPNRMYHIAKRLSRKHTIYYLSYTNHPLAGEIRRQLDAIEIPIRNALTTKNLGLYYLVNVPQTYAVIKQVLSKEDIDVVVHANILPSLIASKIAKKFKITCIYDYLDHYPESAAVYYIRGKKVVEQGVRLLVAQALRNSDAVITPSYGLKKVLENITHNKSIYVVPNGVDADLFKPIDQTLARKTIGLDTDYKLALLQGSLDVWMDVASVIKAVSRLRQTIDIRLLIVGFSHKRSYYRLLLEYAKRYNIDKYIYTYPIQQYEKMPIFINASDLVFSPVKKMIMNLATPLKIAEALSCSVPVVTTNIFEYKIWYKYGVFTYNTYADLEKILKKLLNELYEIKKILAKYSIEFRNKFSWEKIAGEYEYILYSISQKR
jgi:glycosyltransferase involved in cell wall biosynthesis